VESLDVTNVDEKSVLEIKEEDREEAAARLSELFKGKVDQLSYTA
jgi:hypothetical protein